VDLNLSAPHATEKDVRQPLPIRPIKSRREDLVAFVYRLVSSNDRRLLCLGAKDVTGCYNDFCGPETGLQGAPLPRIGRE
jgi:hypothetical protein